MPRYSLSVTSADIPPQLIAPPTWLERVLRSISTASATAAIDLRRRRLADAQRLFETADIGLPESIRRDIGMPPLPNMYQDVWQYR